MEKRIILMHQGFPCGWVNLFHVKSRFTLQVEGKELFDGIVRAYVYSKANAQNRVNAGVLMPDGAIMRCEKTYTADALRQLNVDFDAIDSAELVFDDASVVKWYIHNRPEEIFSDTALCASLSKEKMVLCDNNNKPAYVAIPYNERGIFSLAPAFSLTRIESINGKRYSVIGRKADGMPMLAKKTGKMRNKKI